MIQSQKNCIHLQIPTYSKGSMLTGKRSLQKEMGRGHGQCGARCPLPWLGDWHCTQPGIEGGFDGLRDDRCWHGGVLCNCDPSLFRPAPLHRMSSDTKSVEVVVMMASFWTRTPSE